MKKTGNLKSALEKITLRWQDLDKFDRKADTGSSFGVYFTSGELRDLNEIATLIKKAMRS